MFSIVGEVIHFLNESPKRRGEVEVTLLSTVYAVQDLCNGMIQSYDLPTISSQL